MTFACNANNMSSIGRKQNEISCQGSDTSASFNLIPSTSQYCSQSDSVSLALFTQQHRPAERDLLSFLVTIGPTVRFPGDVVGRVDGDNAPNSILPRPDSSQSVVRSNPWAGRLGCPDPRNRRQNMAACCMFQVRHYHLRQTDRQTECHNSSAVSSKENGATLELWPRTVKLYSSSGKVVRE